MCIESNIKNEDIQQSSLLLIEQYKIYVEISDRVSQRRHNIVSTFFSSINTLIISGYGILSSLKLNASSNNKWMILISISGILYCIHWRMVTKVFQKLLAAKFHVIQQIEERLPMDLYNKEYEFLVSSESHSQKYLKLTSFEHLIPSIFILIYIILCFSVFF